MRNIKHGVTMAGGKSVPFKQDNAAYEKWLADHCDVVKPALECKHKRMRKSPFVFMRATYFRWAKRIPIVCPELMDAPKALCVGDLHAENFGTWRDAEGRWVWGVNDFDEAAIMPYTLDLVRLATSMRLADGPKLGAGEAAELLLKGYREGLRHPGPTLLDERELWMRAYVACTDKERKKFWADVDRYPEDTPPPAAKAGLLHSLPTGAAIDRIASRQSGGGSLGRPRYVAIATAAGGRVVREAKALVPSAWTWAHGPANAPSLFLKLAQGQYRSPDPHLAVHGKFIIRRIAPDSRKIDLARVHGMKFTDKVPWAMGYDVASIHAAHCASLDDLEHHLAHHPRDWLRKAARAARQDVERDFDAWVKR
jgi:hypothetical protein